MKILIKVTKDVLYQSRLCNMDGFSGSSISTNCAVAIAVRDIFPNAQIWGETANLLGFGKYGNVFNENKYLEDSTNIPIEAQVFIDEFDHSCEDERINLDPISFEITVPQFVVSRISIGDVYKIISESKTLELVQS